MQGMDVEDWVELIQTISVNTCDDIFSELSEIYQADIDTSPLWNLKRTFEENNILNTHNPFIIIHTFLVMNNREVKKDELLYALLYNGNNVNINDLILRILGATNMTTYQKHIETDQCIIIKYMRFDCAEFLSELMHKNAHVLGGESHLEKSLHSRPSILRIQKQIIQQQTHGISQDEKMTDHQNRGAVYYPTDVDNTIDKWRGLSHTECQIFLLFICKKPVIFPDSIVHIRRISKVDVKTDMSAHTFHANRVHDVVLSLYPLLTRCGDYIDVSKEAVILILSKFKEFCYTGVFGVTQQKMMTVSFNIQLYIIAYLDEQSTYSTATASASVTCGSNTESYFSIRILKRGYIPRKVVYQSALRLLVSTIRIHAPCSISNDSTLGTDAKNMGVFPLLSTAFMSKLRINNSFII